MTKPYAIYCRQSRDRTGAGLAIERQLADCRALALALGLHGEEALYVDNDLSASNSKTLRPGYERLLAAIRSAEHDRLLIWHNDRLHRRPAELERFIEVAESTNLLIHTVQAGALELSTPTGRLVARIVGAVARQEIEHRSARQRAAIRQRALAGHHQGSQRRFGYGRDIVTDGRLRSADIETVNEAEALAVRRAFDLIAAGEPPHTVWKDWNARGITTVRGLRWTASNFWKLLRGDYLAGRVVHHGEVLPDVASAWPAIVPVELFTVVQTMLGNATRDGHQRAPRTPRQLGRPHRAH